ncbi:MAG: RAMP superfamily CRISPR-associated protein [Pseudomonadota bacterium]
MITSLDAEFALVTPAFAGGANPQAGPAALRVEGIIGQLRRWWWAAAPLQEGYTERVANQFANQLFGAAGKKDTLDGQGAVLITLTRNSCDSKTKTALTLGPVKELFGPLYDNRTQALAPGSFTLRFVLRPGCDPTLLTGLARSLRLWGLLGGFGAGQNRGFGSVSLRQMTGTNYDVPEFTPPDSLTDYKEAIKGVIGNWDTLPATGKNQTFDAFTRNAEGLSATIHAMVMPAAADGLAVLSKVSSDAVAVNVARQGAVINKYGWLEPHTIKIFSRKGARNPSPYHFHVAPLGAGFILLVTTLIRDGGVAAAISEIEGPAKHNLFADLGLTKIWP